jgi:simple sugar transport system ATP-binding protein
MLVPNCTVAQNVVLGPSGSRWLRLRQNEREVAELAERYGLQIDPRTKVEALTPTERQRAEILAALWRGRKCLILDEPTSVLGLPDIEQLFATMRRVADEGCAVIFTSHKLREVLEICDRISVMRHGELRTTVAAEDADVHGLATLMVGSDLTSHVGTAQLVGETDEDGDEGGQRRDPAGAPADAKSGDVVLRLRPHGAAAPGEPPLGELAVAAGEIVGVAGVEGNGQIELAETIVGLEHLEHVVVELDGRDITGAGAGERAELGIAYVPEEPASRAMIPGFPVSWNLGLRRFREGGSGRWGRWSVNTGALRSQAERAIASFDIRGATPDSRTSALSGGNQQKVVLARELEGNPRLLVIVSPTVGLDVGAASAVHDSLRQHRERGGAIVLVSTDLDEIEALSDRIAVLYRGEIVGVVAGPVTDRRAIGLMMTGLHERPRPVGASTSPDVA